MRLRPLVALACAAPLLVAAGAVVVAAELVRYPLKLLRWTRRSLLFSSSYIGRCMMKIGGASKEHVAAVSGASRVAWAPLYDSLRVFRCETCRERIAVADETSERAMCPPCWENAHPRGPALAAPPDQPTIDVEKWP